MKTIVLWCARVTLTAVLVLAITRVADPNRDVKVFTLAPDAVQHALFAYGLTLLSSLALPRVHPLILGAGLLVVCAGLEWVQYLGLLPGKPELKDWLAGLAGIAAGLAPFLAAWARARRRQEPA